MSMLLELNRLRAVDRVVRHFEPSAFTSEAEAFRVEEPVDLEIEVRKDAQKVGLAGQLSTVLTADCCRCLESFPLPVDARFDSVFLPASTSEGEGEQEVSGKDMNVSFYRNDAIDLGDVMREQFYLALPMKPLCQPACRGLCPTCGANRNRQACTCQEAWVDPRLEGLKRFKQ